MEELSYRCRVLAARYIDRNLALIIDGITRVGRFDDLINSVVNLGNIQIVDRLSGIGILKVNEVDMG